MTTQKELEDLFDNLQEDLQEDDSHIDAQQAAWEAPIICRVEVDLPGWLAQLSGGNWEVLDEEEAETCISFNLRELEKVQSKTVKTAEVTLYHNGYAVVNVEGKALFDGSLTTGTSNCAHLSYYDGESGNEILLN